MLGSSRLVVEKGYCKRRTGLLMPCLLLMVATLFTIYVGEFVKLTPFGKYALLGVAFGVMFTLVVWKWSLSPHYGRLDPFELPTWFTINVFMSMVVSGLNGFLNPNALYGRLQGDYSYLVLALVYVCLGTLALWVGYRFGLVRRGPKTKSIHSDVLSNSEHLRLKVVLSLYAASVGIRLFQIATGQYAFLQDIASTEYLWIRQWLYYGAQVWWLVLPAIALRVFRRKRWLLGWIALSLIIMIEWAFTIIGGTKGAIIYVLIILVACRLYVGRGIPWRLVTVLGVLFVIIFPINRLYRPLIISGLVDTHSVIDTAFNVGMLARKTWLERPIGENIQDFLDVVRHRQSQLIQSISLAAYVTPETIPFRYGRDYCVLPLYILVPRVIWPEKPIQGGSVQFSIDYVGMSADTINSSAVTPFGDLYLNFGFPGILGGMFLLGILYRWFYQAVRDANSESKLVLYLGLLLWMTNIEGEIVGIIQGTFQQLIIFYILTRMMYRSAVRSNINSALFQRP